MKQNPRIVFIVPSLKSGGAERVIVTLANNLSQNFKVEIWLMVDSQVEYSIAENIFVDKSYTVVAKGGITRIVWLVNRLKKNKETVVISFMTKLNLYAILAAKLAGVRVIVSERNDPSKTISSKYNGIRELLYRYADKIVFQTNGAMGFFSKGVQKKGSIILNPLRRDVPEIYDGVRKHNIVTISRLHPQKNLKLLIDAFDIFGINHGDYRLIIYGEGPIEQELKTYTAEKELTEKVIFAGVDENVLQKIRDASMFIITSNFEGLSNALLEAMSIGLPCISTDSPPGGARMIIHNGENGILVPVGDKDELVKAMNKIVSDTEFAESIGKEALNIRWKISEEVVCEQWENLINSLTYRI